MDDSDEDTGCPPSSHLRLRPKVRFRNLPPPNYVSLRYTDDEEEDIDEEYEEEAQQSHTDKPLDDEEDLRNLRHRREYSEHDDLSSFDSRGKRRRINKVSMRFEFSRCEPQAAPSKPLARSSPPDWSEESTFLLLDAWGDHFVQNGRKSIRSDEWTDVAKKVSLASKVNPSDAQCRNRVDTLKKKYKKEKASMAENGNAGIKWVYFKKMDSLMSSPSLQPLAGRQKQQHPLPPPRKLQCGIDTGKYVVATPSVPRNDYNSIHRMRDTPGDSVTEDESAEEDDESVGLPWKKENASRRSVSSFKMLVESIQKFGQIYEKMESNKGQHRVQLEWMRKEFQKDLEAQKRQILERVQMEIAKLKRSTEREMRKLRRLVIIMAIILVLLIT